MRDMSSVLTNLGGVPVDARGAIETGWAGKGARLSACRRFVKGLEPFSTGVEAAPARRSEEHTSELQSLMRISYAVFCLKKKTLRISQTSYKLDTQKHTQRNKHV